MIHLWKDPQTGDYGLRTDSTPRWHLWSSGAYRRVDVKPDIVKGHGTKVILFGNTPDANTMSPPDGAPSPSRWVTRYLNTRYFRFPDGITVKAREGWTFDRSDKDRDVPSDNHRPKKGIWTSMLKHPATWSFRTPPRTGGFCVTSRHSGQNTGFINSQGHCSALWNDELYEMTTGRANTSVLQNFGIIFGYQQIVIYVEPKAGPGAEILPNTPRSALLYNGAPLPWADWQEEFRRSMPKEISAHIEAVAAASQASDHTDSIKDRLRQIEELFKLSRYRPNKRGRLLATGETPAAGGGTRSGERPATGEGSAGTNPGKTTSVYNLFLSENGSPAEQAKPDIYPKVNWVSVAAGTRPPGDMEDRAAKYLEKDNQLLVNADFRVFTDMIRRWSQYFASVPGAEAVIAKVVQEWFEQSLVEAVLSSNALRDAQHWSVEDVHQMLSTKKA